MRRFYLRRAKDISGVSGTGDVAEGCVFEHGKVALVWRGIHHTVEILDSVQEVLDIHGHDGATQVAFIDGEE